MSTINDGGPAHPVPGLQHDEGFNGMSLRDRMAMEVMPTLLQNTLTSATVQQVIASLSGGREDAVVQIIAGSAYKIADAMLAERAKVQK